MLSYNKLNKNKYLYFLARLFVILALTFILDFIIGGVLNTLYFKQESGLLYRTTYSLEKTTADLLIFGSSTANHNYSPEIFEKRLDMSSYNVGRDGASIFYHFAILKGVLKRYSPKLIILNFDLDEFVKIQESYDRISSLLPYYRKHPEIRSIIDFKGPNEKFKLLSKIYPYNTVMFTILAGNSEFNKKKNEDFEGYIPLMREYNEQITSSHFENTELDTNKINIYKSFISDCINAKVKLYIICAPHFNKTSNLSSSLILGQKIANEYNIQFFNYSTDSTIISNPSLFADKSHLNYKGAIEFSNTVIDKILSERSQQSVKNPQ